VLKVVAHYEQQTDDEALAEDEAVFENLGKMGPHQLEVNWIQK